MSLRGFLKMRYIVAFAVLQLAKRRKERRQMVYWKHRLMTREAVYQFLDKLEEKSSMATRRIQSGKIGRKRTQVHTHNALAALDTDRHSS